MDVCELASSLDEMASNEKVLFLSTDLPIEDPIGSYHGNILIMGKSKGIKIPVEKHRINFLMELLNCTVMSKGHTVICWNVKELYSYASCHGHDNRSKSMVVDLSLSEAFFDIQKPKPTTYENAVERTKSFASDSNWRKIHSLIHLPLALRVIPRIESKGVIDREKMKVAYPFYEIEGQVNGRFRCYNAHNRSINPHTLSPEVKKNIFPCGENYVFLSFDFNHMEVSVLQWLSGDEQLGDIINSKKDLYLEIYKSITGQEDVRGRKFIKNIFLPIFYGMQSSALVKKYDISLGCAKHLVEVIRTRFSCAMKWVEKQQGIAENNFLVRDFCGRTRHFSERYYRARNFAVQAPAATVCMEKLIELSDELEKTSNTHVIFSVHDAYIVSAPRWLSDKTRELCMDVLSRPSGICPGLTLSASYSCGVNLLELN